MTNFQFSKFPNIIFLLFLSFLVGFSVSAQEDPFSQLTYPIPDLGNCASRDDCEVFCDQPRNAEACLNYALEHNLIPEGEIDMARKMLALGETGGPGGCRAKAECEAYCDNIDHIKECILFAQKHNLIPENELEEARKVIAAIEQGLTPPPCKGKAECDIYCSEPAHMETCIEFAMAAGLMPAGEVEDAKKMLQAIKAGVTPPNCQGKEQCDIYCRQPEHFEECMEFGIAAGFMPPEQIENAKKTLQAIKQGVRPPACQGEEECQVYCSQPEHMQECMEFGLAAGFIPPEDIENAKKTLQALKQGFRPPACQGEEECQVYCSQPEHMEECINFSEAAGFMSEEQAAQARKMMELGITGGPGGCQGEEECQAFCQDPANFETCIDFAVKTGEMTPEEAEQAKQGMKIQQMEIIEPGMMEPGMGEGEPFMEGETPYEQMPPEGMPYEEGPYEMVPPEGEMVPPEQMVPPQEMMPLPQEMETPSQEIAPQETAPVQETVPLESPESRSGGWQQFLAAMISIFLR